MTSAPEGEPSNVGVLNRWYSILGFHFSRRQAIRAAMVLLVGGIAFGVAFFAWYIPPRATSRLVRSVGGSLFYRSESLSNVFVVRIFDQQARLVGLTATDEKIDGVQLHLSHVNDSWLHHLKPLEGLTTLHIHERQLGPGLAELAEIPELTNVVVWHLCTGDLGHLRLLPHLTGVSLVQASCTDVDLSGLASLPQLQFMEFTSSQLTDRLSEQIARIESLQTLNIAHARLDANGVKEIEHLAKLPKLRTLYLRGITDETAAILATMPSLRFLMIDDANLTDVGAASLAQLTGLQTLQLQNCVSPININALRKQMVGCQIYYSVRQSSARPTPSR